MNSAYACSGMLAYQFPSGAYQVLDSSGQTPPLFVGYLQHHDDSNRLFHLNPQAKFQTWSGNTHHNIDRKITRPAKPGKGFFSSGRGDGRTWRQNNSSYNSSGGKTKKDESIKRTIYVTDVDQKVTEEQLAMFFKSCGTVRDCRVCGDPNSDMRFAFIEFATDSAAEKAIELSGSYIGDTPLHVVASKTAIVPVNTDYLPKTSSEKEKVMRTIYAANIDKKVDKGTVKRFFEQFCGTVNRIRLLGDWQHATCIAFVEFENAASAKKALKCSGALLGTLSIRVSPSKTPVRDDTSGNY